MKKSIFKKILALALSVSMVASTATVGFADEFILEEPAGYDEEISFDEPAAAETEAPVVEEQEIIEEQEAVQDVGYIDYNNIYTITWLDDDGTPLGSAEFYGESAVPDYERDTQNELPTKQSTAEFSYEFDRWDPTPVMVTDNATYTAVYSETKNKYQVLFKNGNEVLQDTEIEYGASPVYEGEDPTKEDGEDVRYEFKGWNPEITIVTGTAIYTAEFTAIYPMTYEDVVEGDLPEGAVLLEEYSEETPDYILPDLSRDGYNFDGWTCAELGVDTPTTALTITNAHFGTLTGAITLVANWSAKEYTITVDADGGVINDVFTNPIVYTYDPENGPVLPDPDSGEITKQFEELDGWKIGEDTIDELTPSVVVEKANDNNELTVTAVWKKEVYTITWYDEDGTELGSADYWYHSATPDFIRDVPGAEEPTKESTAEYEYVFSGWEPEVSIVEGNASYNAVYEAVKRSYTIKFANGDDVLQSDVLEYGETPEYTGEVPTKDPEEGVRYEFEAWDPEIVPVEGEETYKAVFTAIYAIEYEKAEAYVENPDDLLREYSKYSEDYTLPVLERNGYTFAGWTCAELGIAKANPELTVTNEQFADASGVLTFVANWTRNKYELTYDLDGGDWEESDKDKVKYEYSVISPTFTLPTPVRENYDFAGWIIDGEGEPQLTVTYRKGSADGPHDFTATWEANEFSIKYALAKGQLPEGEENPTTYTKDSEDIILVNPERTGYEFAGWTGTDLLEPTMEVVIPSGSTGDREYTATWERGIYEITYDLAGGDWPVDEEGNEIVGKSPYSVKSPTFTLPKPEKLFYDFAGWVLEGEEEPVKEVTIEKGTADGPRAYTAVWEPTEFNVYLDPDGGEWDVEDIDWFTINIEEGEKQLPGSDAIHYDGFIFGGWVFDGIEEVFTDSIDFYTVASNADEFGDFNLTAFWLDPVAYVVEGEDKVYFATFADAVNYVKENMAPETPIHIVSQPDDPYLLTEENETIYVIPEAEIDDDALFWNDDDRYYIQKDYLEEAIAYTLMRKVFVFFSSEEDLENGSDPYTVSFVEETTETAEQLLPNEEPEMEGAVFEGWKEAFAEEDGWVYGDVIPVEEWADLDFSYQRFFVASFAPYVAQINKVGFFATFAEAVDAFYNKNQKNYAVRMLRQPAEDDMAVIDPEAKALKINYNYVVEGEEEFDVAANLDFNRDVFKLNVSEPDKNGNQRYTLASYVFTFFKEENKDVTEETEPYYEVEVAYIDEDHPISPAEDPEAEDGYEFVGWEDFQGNLVEDFEDYLGGDASFCGSYAPEEYNITYLDGETPLDLAPATYTIEEEVVLPSAGNKEGYTFDCWLDENGEKATTIALGSTGDKTFTAQWKANAKPYKITLTASAGASAAPTMDPAGGTYDYRTEVALTAAAPQSGYEFAGWYNKKGKLISKKNPYKVLVMSDVTLEARYVPVN